jgi:chromosome segregation ATPase
VPEYEAKIAIIGQEIERLNGLLRSRGEEIASAEGKLRIFEREYESLQRKLGDQEGSLSDQKKYRILL